MKQLSQIISVFPKYDQANKRETEEFDTEEKKAMGGQGMPRESVREKCTSPALMMKEEVTSQGMQRMQLQALEEQGTDCPLETLKGLQLC